LILILSGSPKLKEGVIREVSASELKVLELTISNTFSRFLLRNGLVFCRVRRTSRLEHALELFSGASCPVDKSCMMYSFFVKMLLRTGGMMFSADESSLKNFVRDPTVRRGFVSVLRGIAKYGITKPQILDAPFLVVWNFTNACNLKCKHCYQRAGIRAIDELTTEEKFQAVEELARAGVVSIAFSGGEPLVAPDFYDVVGKVKEEGMYAALATNGTLITRKVAKKLKDVGVGYVEISLDSAKPERHDDFRGVPGSFSRALEGIKHCVDQGVFTCVATTVTQLNLHEIPDIIDLTEKLRAQRFMAFNFIPAGRGADVAEIDLSPEQREDLLKMLMNKNFSGRIQALSTAPQLARVSLQMSGGEIVAPTHMYVGGRASLDLKVLADFIGGCGAGRLYGALQPNGDVTPCVFMPELIAGNIRKSSFLDIWNRNEVMQRLRNRSLLKGHCGNCRYKHVCGGCRARALGYFNDVMAPDPGCIRELEEPSVRALNFPIQRGTN